MMTQPAQTLKGNEQNMEFRQQNVKNLMFSLIAEHDGWKSWIVWKSFMNGYINGEHLARL